MFRWGRLDWDFGGCRPKSELKNGELKNPKRDSCNRISDFNGLVDHQGLEPWAP